MDKVRATEKLEATIKESLYTQERFFAENMDKILSVFERIARALQAGGKLLIMGNGGSAADAQHLAAELINRYRRERSPLPAIALTTDSSILTAIGNDCDFRYLFSRQIEALGRKGDVLLAISTSGNSSNILEGVSAAKKIGIQTFGLTGGEGGRLKGMADMSLCVSRTSHTPRIQEVLFLLEHLLCEYVEDELFPDAPGV